VDVFRVDGTLFLCSNGFRLRGGHTNFGSNKPLFSHSTLLVVAGRQATLGVSPKATGVRRARPVTTTGSIAAGGASPSEFNKLVYESDLIRGTGVS